MTGSQLMLLRSILTLYKTEFQLNHGTEAEIDCPTSTELETHIHDHNEVYIYPKITSGMGDGTETEHSDREGKLCCPSHCRVETHRSGGPEYGTIEMWLR